MKKLLCLLLAVTMLMGSLFILSACDKKDKKDRDDEETTEKNVIEAPVAPKGYTLYEDDYIYFVYPEDWSKTVLGADVGVMLLDGMTGNNITALGEPYSDIYKNMTVDEFNAMLAPTIAQQSMTVSNVKISQVKNGRDVEITKITYNVSKSGVAMKQFLFIVPSGDRNYAINFTEVKSVTGLVDTVFDSLVAKK